MSYLRSIHLQKDKSIFKVSELPADEFAASLGLPGTPKIKFLSKEKAKEKKNASRVAAALQAEISKERGIPAADEEDSEERSRHESEHSEQQSQNGGGHTNNESEKDTTGTTKETAEQTSTKKETKIVSASTQWGKIPIIDLEREWEQFNKKLHTDSNLEQTYETQTPKQTQHKSNLEMTV